MTYTCASDNFLLWLFFRKETERSDMVPQQTCIVQHTTKSSEKTTLSDGTNSLCTPILFIVCTKWFKRGRKLQTACRFHQIHQDAPHITRYYGSSRAFSPFSRCHASMRLSFSANLGDHSRILEVSTSEPIWTSDWSCVNRSSNLKNLDEGQLQPDVGLHPPPFDEEGLDGGFNEGSDPWRGLFGGEGEVQGEGQKKALRRDSRGASRALKRLKGSEESFKASRLPGSKLLTKACKQPTGAKRNSFLLVGWKNLPVAFLSVEQLFHLLAIHPRIGV